MITLDSSNVRVGARAANKAEAIHQVGELLVKGHYVEPGYIESMMGREKVANTYLGNGIAIPHGLLDDRDLILNTGIAVLQVPAGTRIVFWKSYVSLGWPHVQVVMMPRWHAAGGTYSETRGATMAGDTRTYGMRLREPPPAPAVPLREACGRRRVRVARDRAHPPHTEPLFQVPAGGAKDNAIAFNASVLPFPNAPPLGERA